MFAYFIVYYTRNIYITGSLFGCRTIDTDLKIYDVIFLTVPTGSLHGCSFPEVGLLLINVMQLIVASPNEQYF